MESDRYKRGLDKLREIDREQGERVVASLSDIAPDFATYLIEFPFGDVYSRPGLDLKSIPRARDGRGTHGNGQCRASTQGPHSWSDECGDIAPGDSGGYHPDGCLCGVSRGPE